MTRKGFKQSRWPGDPYKDQILKIKIDADLKNELKSITSRKGMSVHVRTAIEEYIKNYKLEIEKIKKEIQEADNPPPKPYVKIIDTYEPDSLDLDKIKIATPKELEQQQQAWRNKTPL
jgi:antitoxin component of RelBE/YafQ-DinJ toxin-antitoxin module